MSKLIVCAVAVFTLLILSRPASAGERTAAPAEDVSTSVLADLGLTGLRPISDRQGLQIRGRAFDGTPGKGPFTTLPANALSKGDLGVIEHGTIKEEGHTTTIVNHPQFGTLTLPRQLTK